MLQNASGITKCDTLLLQSASGITKCDSYYKVRRDSGINTDITDNHANNHEVNTNTNDKTNIQTISYKKNDKTTAHRDNDGNNFIKRSQ